MLGHQKGRNTKENMHRNFGMARPEGYRKATRLMRLASRFRRPILCFIDTPGAYPGLGAEERGQAEAIAKALQVMASLDCPMISVVIGEGGSGGALALGVTDRILMLEYSIYSVISPEGCASILWRDPSKIGEAAGAAQADRARPRRSSGSATRSSPRRPAARTATPRSRRRSCAPRSRSTCASWPSCRRTS